MATAVCMLWLAACGDDHAVTPDAALDAAWPDAPACPVPPSEGTLAFTSTRAARVHDGAGKETVAWLGALAIGATADVLDIQLLQGSGAFAGGPPTTGTFALSGAEIQLATCGICVVFEVGSPREYFVAQSGTLVIDELGPTGTGHFRASLSNATLPRVTIDPATNHSTVVGDGCQTTIVAASWDTPIN